ncbi:MAG TPA: alanine racemase [Gemmatimonadales bacterium]|nr:alanine racemase [Gemmatimonadales bacterium]
MSPSNPPNPARAWADVSLAALRENARTIQRTAGSRLLPMVKADGYGLGAVPVARALEPLDPWGFGVATVGEAVELRAAGITRPVMVFTPATADAVAIYARHDLRAAIGDLDALRGWVAAGLPFHLEIDTGMSRAGIRWDDPDALAAAAATLAAAPGWEGAFTHFHSADTDRAETARQWDRLTGAMAGFPRRPSLVHAANSAAALAGPAWAGDLVRPGIFLYGGGAGGPPPAPVAALRAPVVAVRRLPAGGTVSYGATWTAPEACVIATVAAGYADGVPRALSGRGEAELGGVRVPFVGRVTMDMTMVRVDSSVRVGDVATLYGGLVGLDEQAARANTISYELLTSIGRRVPRRYREA